jgi:hypothetical protein
MVMGDASGNFTTVLNLAYAPIKDNRLPPIGFTTLNNAYDTVLIAGNALTDPDFNFTEGIEGSGSDHVFYHVAMNGYLGELTISLNVQYQTIHPRWLSDMFNDDTPEINLFKQMVEEADLSPVLVAEKSLELGIISSVEAFAKSEDWIKILQSNHGEGISIDLKEPATIMVYNIEGRLIAKQNFNEGSSLLKSGLPDGILIIVAVSKSNKRIVKKLLTIYQ